MSTESEDILTDDLAYGLALFGSGQVDSMGLGVSSLEGVDGTWAVSTDTGTKHWHLADYLLRGTPVATSERLSLPCETESATDEAQLLGDNPGALLSVDPQTGQSTWAFHDHDHGFQGVASNGEAVLAWTAPPLGTTGTFYCLDIDDGDLRWSIPTGGHDDFEELLMGDGNLVVRDDEVVIPTDDGLIALDLDDGAVIWRFHTEGRRTLDLAVGPAVIYLSDWDGALYAVDTNSDDTRWRFERPPPEEGITVPIFHAMSKNAGLLVGFETKQEGITAISTRGEDAGEQRWSRELDGPFPFQQAITVGTEHVYVGAYRAGGTEVVDLLAFDVETGSLEWESSMEGTPAPPVVPTEFGLIVPWGSGQDSPLQVIDPATGDVLESFPDIGQSVWDLIVDSDRGVMTAHVQRVDGNALVGIDLDVGERQWTFDAYDGGIYQRTYGV